MSSSASSSNFNQACSEVINQLSDRCDFTSPPVIDDDEVEDIFSNTNMNMDKKMGKCTNLKNCQLNTPKDIIMFNETCLFKLTKAVKTAIRMLDSRVVNYKNQISKASEIKVHLVDLIKTFSDKFTEFKELRLSYLVNTEPYQHTMATLLSIYLDIETLAFRRDVEKKGVVIKRICQLLDVNLDHCNDSYFYFCETLLQTLYFIDRLNRKLSIPILRYVLKAIPRNDKTDSASVTIQRILMFRVWKCMEVEERSHRIVSRAVRTIKLTKKFKEELYDGKYRFILPELNPLKRDKTVKCLMNTKFNVFIGIQAFVYSFLSSNGRQYPYSVSSIKKKIPNGRKYPYSLKKKGKKTSNDVVSQNQQNKTNTNTPDTKLVKKRLTEAELMDSVLGKRKRKNSGRNDKGGKMLKLSDTNDKKGSKKLRLKDRRLAFLNKLKKNIQKLQKNDREKREWYSNQIKKKFDLILSRKSSINCMPSHKGIDSGHKNTIKKQPASHALSISDIASYSITVNENNVDTIENNNVTTIATLNEKVTEDRESAAENSSRESVVENPSRESVVENPRLVGNSSKSNASKSSTSKSNNSISLQESGDKRVNGNTRSEESSTGSSMWKDYKQMQFLNNKGENGNILWKDYKQNLSQNNKQNSNQLQTVQSLDIKSDMPLGLGHTQDRNANNPKEIRSKGLSVKSEENNQTLTDRRNTFSTDGVNGDKFLETITAVGLQNCGGMKRSSVSEPTRKQAFTGNKKSKISVGNADATMEKQADDLRKSDINNRCSNNEVTTYNIVSKKCSNILSQLNCKDEEGSDVDTLETDFCSSSPETDSRTIEENDLAEQKLKDNMMNRNIEASKFTRKRMLNEVTEKAQLKKYQQVNDPENKINRQIKNSEKISSSSNRKENSTSTALNKKVCFHIPVNIKNEDVVNKKDMNTKIGRKRLAEELCSESTNNNTGNCDERKAEVKVSTGDNQNKNGNKDRCNPCKSKPIKREHVEKNSSGYTKISYRFTKTVYFPSEMNRQTRCDGSSSSSVETDTSSIKSDPSSVETNASSLKTDDTVSMVDVSDVKSKKKIYEAKKRVLENEYSQEKVQSTHEHVELEPTSVATEISLGSKQYVNDKDNKTVYVTAVAPENNKTDEAIKDNTFTHTEICQQNMDSIVHHGVLTERLIKENSIPRPDNSCPENISVVNAESSTEVKKKTVNLQEPSTHQEIRNQFLSDVTVGKENTVNGRQGESIPKECDILSAPGESSINEPKACDILSAQNNAKSGNGEVNKFSSSSSSSTINITRDKYLMTFGHSSSLQTQEHMQCDVEPLNLTRKKEDKAAQFVSISSSVPAATATGRNLTPEGYIPAATGTGRNSTSGKNEAGPPQFLSVSGFVPAAEDAGRNVFSGRNDDPCQSGSLNGSVPATISSDRNVINGKNEDGPQHSLNGSVPENEDGPSQSISVSNSFPVQMGTWRNNVHVHRTDLSDVSRNSSNVADHPTIYAHNTVSNPSNNCISIGSSAFHNKPSINLHNETQHHYNEVVAWMSNILRIAKEDPNFNNQVFQLPNNLSLMNDSIQLKQNCSCSSCKILLDHVDEYRNSIYNCYTDKMRKSNIENSSRLQNELLNGQEWSYNSQYSHIPSHFINMNEAVQRGIFRPYPRGEPSNGGINNMQYNNNPKRSENNGSGNATLSSNYSDQIHGSNSSIVNDANKCAIIKRIYSMPNRKNSASKSKKGGVQCGSSRDTTNTQTTRHVTHTNTLDKQLKFSTNTFPTSGVNRSNPLDEQFRFSTNTLSNSGVNHANSLDEQLRFSTNTLPTSGVNHANALCEQLRFSTNTLPTSGVTHTNALGEQLRFGTNALPNSVNQTNLSFAQGALKQGMLLPPGFQNHSFGSRAHFGVQNKVCICQHCTHFRQYIENAHAMTTNRIQDQQNYASCVQYCTQINSGHGQLNRDATTSLAPPSQDLNNYDHSGKGRSRIKKPQPRKR